MEAKLIPSEKVINFQRTTRRYIPEDRTLLNHRCQNFRSYIIIISSYSSTDTPHDFSEYTHYQQCKFIFGEEIETAMPNGK
jgi:hypothetical protein